MKARSNCCSTPTPWPTAASCPSARSASAPTTACWPTASTPAATKSTPCTSRTWPAARHALPFDDCDGSLTWANDSQTLFFAELDDTHRPWRLRRHTLGTAAQTVFEEPDGRFFLHCYRTSSERQLVLLLGSKTTSEAWVLDAEPRSRSPAWRHGSKATNTSPTTASSTASGAGSSAATRTASTSPCTTPPTPPVPSRRVATWWRTATTVMLDGLSLNAGALTLSLREGGLPIIEVRPQGLPAYRVELPTPPTACTCRTAWSSPATASACATKR
jgi:protease II